MSTKIRKTELGSPELLGVIIGIGKSLGWWEERVWHPEIAGRLVDNRAEGGILDALEKETSETFPHLRSLRQEVVNAWWEFDGHRWEFWRRKALAQAYDGKLREFANAVTKAAQEWAEKRKIPIAGLPVIWDWIKGNLPLVGLGAGFVSLITVILLVRRKR